MAAAKKQPAPPRAPVPAQSPPAPSTSTIAAGAFVGGVTFTRERVVAMLDEDRRAQSIEHRRHADRNEHAEADAAMAVLKYIEALQRRIRAGEP